MRTKTIVRRLGLLALVLGLALPLSPAHAGTSGVRTDKANDVVDFLRHPQNSFRPDPLLSPWRQYQTMCAQENPLVANCKPFDVRESSVTTNATAQTITFNMKIAQNFPSIGSPTATIPPPFQSAGFAWYFTTSTQEKRLKIGINCSGIPDPDNPNNVDDFTVNNVGAKIVYSGIPAASKQCGKAANAAAEATGTASGTRTVENVDDVTVPPHYAGDGWMGVVDVELSAVANGSPKGFGTGTVSCAGGAVTCLDYAIQFGQYEGYTGISLLQDARDMEPVSQGKTSISISGNSLTVTIPYAPATISADGDLLIDDARVYPWPFGEPNSKFTNLVAETTGIVGYGVNTVPQVQAVCTDKSDNPFPEGSPEVRQVGQQLGAVNKAVNDATKGGNADADPASDPVGYVKGQASQQYWGSEIDPDGSKGIWLFGTGGTDQGDCIRGLYGLLTLLDWTDGGIEIRQFPRSPGYAPSATSLGCRYPVSTRPWSFLPAGPNVALGPTSAPSVEADTSPFDNPWKVEAWALSKVAEVPLPALPNPNMHVGPLDGIIGRDTPCNYTVVPYVLHYFDILSADFTM